MRDLKHMVVIDNFFINLITTLLTLYLISYYNVDI